MENTQEVIKRQGRWAPTRNLILGSRAMERGWNRSENLPGIIVFDGPSGVGKSQMGSFVTNKFGGIYVPCRSFFTRRTFVEAILKEAGVHPRRTLSEMMEQIAAELDLSQRPLIVDECDHLLDRRLIEIVRDLHDMSRTTIMLIGEEQFPRRLKRLSDRFYNRVLVWQTAQLASRDDAHQLAAFYCPDVTIAEDLLESIRKSSAGVARVICVNLDAVREHCQRQGLKKIDLDTWGKRSLYTGDAPAREPDARLKSVA